MRRSKILAKIRAGQVARVCSMGSPIATLPVLGAHFRYDGVWVDGEHRAWEAREIDSMIARHHAADIDCMWRPSTKEKNSLYRLLEDGASGLMIPHVSTAEEARALVQSVKFPPMGNRGIDGAGRDASFLVGAPVDYVEQANRETFLVVQIETPEALENAEAIAAVPGVDVIFLGPGDMSLRLGCSASVDDPKMMEVQRKIAAAAHKHGKTWGRPVGEVKDARTIIQLGALLVCFGGEFKALHQHFSECARHFDEILAESADAVPAGTSRTY
jgi:2-keto-3-deoxy-L-rhamnonate aldolase RhmA